VRCIIWPILKPVHWKWPPKIEYLDHSSYFGFVHMEKYLNFLVYDIQPNLKMFILKYLSALSKKLVDINRIELWFLSWYQGLCKWLMAQWILRTYPKGILLEVGGDVSPNPWVLKCALNVLAPMNSSSQTFVSKNQIVMDDQYSLIGWKW
jgi:hypothetical protein